ncbi:MAG: hypothetical protein HYR76_07565 [Ignavibacteria bacterium]|nr:hypothetical protein [Ignavibacteria bacterium]
MPARLGIIPDRYARPLFSGLLELRDTVIELVQDTPTRLAIQLRQAQLDGAFLSPIDYAKNYSHYHIVPDIGAVSEGESGAALLLFRENMQTMKTLAVDPNSSSEIVLAHLILAEKYDIMPTLVPFEGSSEEGLKRADAVVAVGDTALRLKTHTNKLDLVDEWKDISDMPFVHGIWVVRNDSLSDSVVAKIAESRDKGPNSMGEASPGYDDLSISQFRYDLDEEAVDAMNEFFRMAYYHGILKDIPEVKFYESNDRDILSGNPSPN